VPAAVKERGAALASVLALAKDWASAKVPVPAREWASAKVSVPAKAWASAKVPVPVKEWAPAGADSGQVLMAAKPAEAAPPPDSPGSVCRR